MSSSLFKSVVDQLRSPLGGSISLTGLGEPLLHPRLVAMVQYAKAAGLSVGFFSNFTLMSRSVAAELIDAELDWVSVSFDGASKASFEQLRAGAVFEEVVKNVKTFMEIRNAAGALTPRVFMSVTVCEANVGEVPSLVQAAEELGVREVNLIPRIRLGHTFPTREVMSVLRQVQPSRQVKVTVAAGRPGVPCCAVNSCYVTYDGRVLACPALMELIPREEYAGVQFGDLREASLSRIWFSERYQRFRNALKTGGYTPFAAHCPFSGRAEA